MNTNILAPSLKLYLQTQHGDSKDVNQRNPLLTIIRLNHNDQQRIMNDSSTTHH